MLPKEIFYKSAKSFIREPELVELLVRDSSQIENFMQNLKEFEKENLYPQEKTGVMKDSLLVLLRALKLYLNSVLKKSELKEIKQNQNNDLLCVEEIDALLTSWTKFDIDLTVTPDETDEEKYKRLHGVGLKPEYALVLVDVETWLCEKHSGSFWGWAYAINFLSKIKNKKFAHVREYPNARYPWVSRNKEFYYDFDGETVKEEKDLPKIIRGYESEQYMGELPSDIPQDASFREHEVTKALAVLETDGKGCICDFRFVAEDGNPQQL